MVTDYPLQGFSDGAVGNGSGLVVITRGPYALQRAAKHFPRGVCVSEVNALPINAARLYSETHPLMMGLRYSSLWGWAFSDEPPG